MDAMSQIQKKIFLSTIRDGLTEIFIGLLLLIAGFVFYNPFLVVLVIILKVLWSKIEQKLKERYIFPRIGYVELKTTHRSNFRKYHTFFGIIIAISVISFFVLVFLEGWNIDTMFKYVPLLPGGALLGKSLYFCIFSSKWKYLGLGIISLFLAIAFILIPFPVGRDVAVYYLWLEAIIMASVGILKYFNFLNKYPVVQEKNGDGG
ncbi:MAG: hypothetical protein ACFFCS_23625 [Candidatus Hodarchaeota archaeon]